MKRIYVIDDLLLFNPCLGNDKEVYHYNELNKIRNFKWSPIVEFITADINSVLFITDKMRDVFGFFGPLTVILRDDTKRKILTAADLLFLVINKEKEKKHLNELAKKVSRDINRIFECKSKKIQGISDPVYIKTTMCFGIQSGGAVAHSAGVISEMKKKYRNMDVYTTDFLPENLVDRSVTKISLTGFRDYYDEAKMYLNLSAYNTIRNSLENRKPVFVYQR